VFVAVVVDDETTFCFGASGASFSFDSGFLAALSSVQTMDVFPGPRRLMIFTSLTASTLTSSVSGVKKTFFLHC